MKPVWIVLLCLLGAAVLAALAWLLVWYIAVSYTHLTLPTKA